MQGLLTESQTPQGNHSSQHQRWSPCTENLTTPLGVLGALLAAVLSAVSTAGAGSSAAATAASARGVAAAELGPASDLGEPP